MIDLQEVLVFLLVLVVELGVLAWLVTLAAVDYRGFVRFWRPALVTGVIVLLLSIPGGMLNALYFEPSAMNPHVDEFQQTFMRIGNIGGNTLAVVMAGVWAYLSYYVAVSEWRRVRDDAMPWLDTVDRVRRFPWRGVAIGGGIGIFYGLVTGVWMDWLGVKESQVLIDLLRNYPGLEDASLAVTGPVFALVVLLAAFTEELTFRGAFFGFMLARCGRGRLAVLGSTLLIAAVFALLHVFNTDAPMIKMVQIFVFSIILTELARRANLESAIACHLGLNASALPWMWMA